MFALKYKKSGKLLSVLLEIEDYGDYGGWEITWQTYHRPVMKLYDSEYPGVLFVTSEEQVVKDLLREGKTTSPFDIRIDFGWGSGKFNNADLEVVTVKPQ